MVRIEIRGSHFLVSSPERSSRTWYTQVKFSFYTGRNHEFLLCFQSVTIGTKDLQIIRIVCTFEGQRYYMVQLPGAREQLGLLTNFPCTHIVLLTCYDPFLYFCRDLSLAHVLIMSWKYLKIRYVIRTFGNICPQLEVGAYYK